jgi:MSHA biogenesis protein MshP
MNDGMHNINNARGFMLVTVLFLITVVAVLVAVMSTTVGVQHISSAYSLQQVRAFAAAAAGLDYGVQRATSAGVCTNGGVTLPGISFNVTVSCVSTPGIDEAGNLTTVYQLSSTASTGVLGDVGYVTRAVRSTVSNP